MHCEGHGELILTSHQKMVPAAESFIHRFSKPPVQFVLLKLASMTEFKINIFITTGAALWDSKSKPSVHWMHTSESHEVVGHPGTFFLLWIQTYYSSHTILW